MLAAMEQMPPPASTFAAFWGRLGRRLRWSVFAKHCLSLGAGACLPHTCLNDGSGARSMRRPWTGKANPGLAVYTSLAALLLAASSAVAQQGQFPGIEAPPTEADYSRFYPPEALRAQRGASVVLQCEVNASGALRDCTVLETTILRCESGECMQHAVREQDRFGFAAASRRLGETLRARLLREGGLAAVGDLVKLRLEWAPEYAPRAAEPAVSPYGDPAGPAPPYEPELPAAAPYEPYAPAAAPDFTGVPGIRLASGRFYPIEGIFDRAPGGPDFARLYPPEALRQGLSGSVTVQCAVGYEGRLNDCYIIRESPTRVGFGGASLQLVNRFIVAPETGDGEATEGATVTIEMLWRGR